MDSALANLEAAMQSLQEAKSHMSYDSSTGNITSSNQLDAATNAAGGDGNNLATQNNDPGYGPMDGPMTGSGSTIGTEFDTVGAESDTVGTETTLPPTTVDAGDGVEGMGEEHTGMGWWNENLEQNPDNAGVDFNAEGNHADWSDEWGDPNDSDDDDGMVITLYENELYDQEQAVVTIGDTVEGQFLGMDTGAGGELDLLGYEVEAGVAVTYQDGEFTAGAMGEASAYLVQAEVEANLGAVSVGANGMVGAEVNGQIGLEFDWEEAEVELGAEVGFMAGAEGSINGEVDLHYGAVEGTLTGIAGVSAEAHGNIELENWEFSYDFGASAALGLGAGFELEGSVDFIQIGSDAVAVGTAIGETAVDVGTAIGETAVEVGTAIGETAVDVGTAIGETATNVGTAIGETASDIGEATAEVFEDVVDFGEDAIDVAGEALDDGVETIGEIAGAIGGALSGF